MLRNRVREAPRKILSGLLVVTVLIFFGAYHYFNASGNDSLDDRYAIPIELMAPSEQIGCRRMVENFCGKLYSPGARGNLNIRDAHHQYTTLQGDTRNDFDQAWFAFYRARLERAQSLPSDLKMALIRRDFFEEVRILLRRPARLKMQFDSSISFEDLEERIDANWDRAIDETVSRRLERKYPGSFRRRLGEDSQHVQAEKARIRAKLWSEISLALWRGHPNWKRVVTEFGELKHSFLSAISEFRIEDATKQKWAEKIQSVRLALPGEDPMTAAPECVSVTRNAYYYKYLNIVTVCAGYFTGGSQILTLAHELAHALDFTARLIDAQQSSSFAHSFLNLKTQVCSSKTQFDCAHWTAFKSSFEKNLAELAEIEAEAPDVHTCLQKTRPSKALTRKVIEAKASDQTRSRYSEMASNATFFRLTNKEISKPNGTKVKNPSYLNPCADEIWGEAKYSFDSEFPSRLFFSAAYSCSSEEGVQRLRSAILESKDLSEKLLNALILNEKAFSAREDLQSEGYSSPPTERFADRIGSYAVAKYLEKFKTVQSKRSAYLASSFWLCERPSLKTENFEQYQALNEFIIDRGVHPENGARITDWLSPPVRAALGCNVDFEPLLCESLDGIR